VLLAELARVLTLRALRTHSHAQMRTLTAAAPGAGVSATAAVPSAATAGADSDSDGDDDDDDDDNDSAAAAAAAAALDVGVGTFSAAGTVFSVPSACGYLLAPAFRQRHPTLFWNLVWRLCQLNLPLLDVLVAAMTTRAHQQRDAAEAAVADAAAGARAARTLAAAPAAAVAAVAAAAAGGGDSATSASTGTNAGAGGMVAVDDSSLMPLTRVGTDLVVRTPGATGAAARETPASPTHRKGRDDSGI
jgi:hypothetical protein